jgi:galactokinase
MDQFASVFGAKNKVIKLDCNTLEYEYYTTNLSQHSIVLLDSRVKHTHLTSGYNTRRQEVEKGMSIIKSIFPQVNTFRDCTLEMIQSIQSQLGDIIFNRSQFVVKEIQRVQEAAMALQNNQLDQLGALMFETHEGLSSEYEVSCPELDMLVTTAKSTEGIIGSRMMGGGFGGCTINLVKKGFEKNIIQNITKEYQHTFGIELIPYEVEISNGTMLYEPNNQ